METINRKSSEYSGDTAGDSLIVYKRALLAKDFAQVMKN